MIIFADVFQSDAWITIVVLAIVLGLLGEGVVRLTNRMLELRQSIRYWATGLGIITGILFFLSNFAARLVKDSDDLLGNIIASGLVGLGAWPVWYLVVAVFTFLYQYILAPPFRLFGSRASRGDNHATESKPKRGRVLLPLLGGFIGFIAGVVQLAITLQKNPHVSGPAGLGLVGTWTIGGVLAVICLRLFFRILGSLLARNRRVRDDRAHQRRKFLEQEILRTEVEQKEAARMQKRSATQAERDAAREHLADFYATHEDLLADRYPPALMRTFFLCEMPDSLTPAQLWAVCQKKIAEFQPLILQAREERKKEQDRAAKRGLRLKQIESEIRGCREKIARLEKAGFDPEILEDETHGLMMKIRQLEEQKELLMTLSEAGAT